MTTKISAIIAQYIGKETRLIIPEVGTLIRRKESGEIIFMEMLKKNDGALVQLIVNALDVSPSKATEITNRYIGTVKQQLETNKKFILDGVGVILVRPEGGIGFSFNPFAKTIPEPTPAPRPAVATAPRPAAAPQPPMPRPAAPAPQPKPAAPAPAPAPQPKPVAPAPAPKAEQPKPATPAPAPKKEEVQPKKEEQQPAEQPKRVAQPARKPQPKKRPQPKVDYLTIFAIAAAVMALISIFWGFSAAPASDSYDTKKEQRKEYQQPVTLDEAIDSKALYQG